MIKFVPNRIIETSWFVPEDKAKRSLMDDSKYDFESLLRTLQFVSDPVHEVRVKSYMERDDGIDSSMYAYQMLKDQAVVKPIDKEDNKM